MSFITSPFYSLFIGYFYIIFTGIFLYYSHFFKNNSFFSWGPPIDLFGNIIHSKVTFYTLLLLFFINQLFNKWINNIIQPWIINTVQNPKCYKTGFSNFKTLTIVNMFSIYSQFNLLFIVSSATSQISFFIAIILANLISTTFINYQHINNKFQTESIIVKKDNYGTFTVI